MSFLSRIFGRKTNPASSPRHGGGNMVGLVALMPSWRELSVEEVRSMLDALFPNAFLPAKEEGNFVIDGPVPGASFLVQCTIPGHSGTFLIHNVLGPYAEFSDYLSHVTDPAMRELASQQSCWMSVDLMHRHSIDEEAYRFVSTALAQLAPPDAAVLMHPSRNLLVAFSQEVRRTLAAGGLPYGTA